MLRVKPALVMQELEEVRFPLSAEEDSFGAPGWVDLEPAPPPPLWKTPGLCYLERLPPSLWHEAQHEWEWETEEGEERTGLGFFPEYTAFLEFAMYHDVQGVGTYVVATEGGSTGEAEYWEERLHHDTPTTTIGSAVDIMNEAKRIHGPELAKLEAQVAFNSEYANTISTDYSLCTAEVARYKRWAGTDILPRHKKRQTNDHILFAVGREQLDRELERMFPQPQDNGTALHVGATFAEWRLWKSHLGHDFLFCLREGKDVARVHTELVKTVAHKLASMNLPSLRSVKGNATRVTLDGVSEGIKLLGMGEHQRIFMDTPDRRYSTLFFRDSLYNMTPEEFQGYWHKTGAVVGYAVMFFPDTMLQEHAMPSEHYKYEEYYQPVAAVEEVIEQVWPSILLVTPFLPLQGIAEAFREVLRFSLTTGWKFFSTWLTGAATDPYPLEYLAGSLFDVAKLGPIYNHLMSKVRPLLRKLLGRARVNWIGGVSNGYDHPIRRWEHWLKVRRNWLGPGDAIDTEVMARVGEMYLLKFFRTSGTDPITYTLSLPRTRNTVLVADLEASWSHGHQELGEIKYFPQLEADVFKLVNWALGEPLDSLSPEVMHHTLNRIRGGFSLGSNVLVEPMAVDERLVSKVSLAALMYVYQKSNVVHLIESSKDANEYYERNITKWAKQIAKVGLVIATGGLAIPAYFLYRWLMEKNVTVEFVKFLPEVEALSVPGKFTALGGLCKSLLGRPEEKKPAVGLDRRFSLVLPHRDDKAPVQCELCRFQKLGWFSDSTPEKGQQFKCHNSQAEALTSFGFRPEEMPDLLNFVMASEREHGTAKVTQEIRKVKHFVEGNMAGVEHSAELHFVFGGPGTGKTEVIKSLQALYGEAGRKTLYLAPFSKLMKDMVQCSVLKRPGKRDFLADTTWYWPKESNIDVLLVDECTGLDWRIVRLAACFLGVKKVMMFGDDKQTRLRPEAGEGTDVTAPTSGCAYQNFPRHELLIQFRMGRWRTNLHNLLYGYEMVSRRQDDDVPEFVTFEQYAALRGTVERELVFSHVSALEVFGVESNPDESERNMSVRSAQGMTYDTTAIGYTLTDVRVRQAHGMLNVANSRSKQRPLYVVRSLEDEHVVDLRRELHVHTPEAVADIAARVQKLPDPVRLEPQSETEAYIDRYILEKQSFGQVSVDAADLGDSFERVPDLPKQQELVISDVSLSKLEDYDLFGFYRKVFHTCLPEAVVKAAPESAEEVYKYLGAVYANDTLMGRRGQWNPFNWAVTKALPQGCGKRYLSVQHFAQHCKIPNTGYAVFGKPGKRNVPTLVWASPGVRDGTAAHVIWMTVDDNHVELREPFKVDLHVPELSSEQEVSALDRFGDRLAVELACSGGRVPVDAWVYVGLQRVQRPDWSRGHQNLAEAREPLTSAWAASPEKPEAGLPHRQKLRLGTNAYTMLSLVDPSGAVQRPMLNEAGPVQGVTRRTDVKLNLEGFLWDKTRAGKLKRRTQREYRSFNPGVGNHFNNTPEETLLAAQRIGRLEPKPKLGAETRAYAEELARKAYQEYFVPAFRADPDQANMRIAKGLRDARARNYHGRSDAEKAKFATWRLTCSNKDQFKPMKDGKLNLLKPGQVLLQSPATTNLEWMGWNRVRGWLMKDSAKPHLFMDDYESQSGFRTRLCRAIRDLPSSVSVGIADGEEWDSQQNEVTVHAEKTLTKLLGALNKDVEDYYAIRGSLDFLMHGVFRGTTHGEKGSGFLDTKRGNTALTLMVGRELMTGVGPQVAAVKGDDWLRVQSGLVEVPSAARVLRAKTGMRVNVKIGRGGEFCGASVSRAGIYPSITRALLRASAAKARSYEQFAAQQQSYRDHIQEYRDAGLEEVINYSAHAEGTNPESVRTALSILNSLGHISKAQWESAARVRKNPRFFLNSATGPTLL